jgi:DNA-directed RNA polymerase subunit RPC12/RpoP
MKRAAAQCGICGKTLLPEEIEVGASLVCPRCDPKRNKTKPGKGETDTKTRERTPK